ncbi:MAG: hypothetical protein ACI9Y1_001183 [Lentisphaeria bacterium]|jgi:hypothetical protein
MKKHLYIYCITLAVVSVSGCHSSSVRVIESFTSPGYCKTLSGVELSVRQCNQKLQNERKQDSEKTTSDTMAENIRDELEKKK